MLIQQALLFFFIDAVFGDDMMEGPGTQAQMEPEINTNPLLPCTTCPPSGTWSDWVDYTKCSAPCGMNGEKIQTRSCVSWNYGCPCKGAYARKVPCPDCLCKDGPQACAAPYEKVLDCKTKKWKCGGNVTREDDYKKPCCVYTQRLADCPCPEGGVWSAWKCASPCTAKCGLYGTMTQTRTCRSAKYGCPCTGPCKRTIACPEAPCPKMNGFGYQCHNATCVYNLARQTYQCGLSCPPDPTLDLSSCANVPTTN